MTSIPVVVGSCLLVQGSIFRWYPMSATFSHPRTSVILCFVSGLLFHTLSAGLIGLDDWRYDGAAGTDGSLAIPKDDPAINSWATGYENYLQGSVVASRFGDPVKGLGPAEGTSFEVVTLGNGGQITLTFARPIKNSGAGADFAIFENAFTDSFLELAWVEVSSDGVHFVRFPNYSFTNSLAEGGSLDPRDLHGYASKYRQGFGTPFDLDQLRLAYDAAVADSEAFSDEFQQQLISNYGMLNLERITHIRIIDIVGDGSAYDAYTEPFSIFDPLNSSSTSGFDLDAVAVLNEVVLSGETQVITFDEIRNQRQPDGPLRLRATASSGLAPVFTLIEGPASIEGDLLTFEGAGRVAVQVTQPGDSTYAPAEPITQSFYVADETQHIFFAPVPNQTTDSTAQLQVRTTSGLPAIVEVVSGPSDVTVGFPPNITLNTGSTTGTVVLRAYQSGGTVEEVTYAPAEEVIMSFEVVTSGSSDRPQSFEQWQEGFTLSGTETTDSDFDGRTDFEEYVAGTDPRDASERPNYLIHASADRDGFYIDLTVSTLSQFRISAEGSDAINDSATWNDVLPELVSDTYGSDHSRVLRYFFHKKGSREFWRFSFEAND